jgi:hypothetical protein
MADFDGDGRADRAIVHPLHGAWHVLLSGGADSSTVGIPWGWRWTGMGPNHTLALGDYDGDGKTDRAIVDRAAGTWHVLLSSGKDPSTVGIPWGWRWTGMGPNHTLALGDYDGDGKTDRAIVDRVAGNWHILLSSGADSSTVGIPWEWHWAGMGPNHSLALGDYDGDGKTDRAIVDRVAGNWHILLSSGADASTVGIPWGWHWAGMGPHHSLALGDYDGDRKTDRAIVHRETGDWHILLSSGADSGTVGIPWGWRWFGMGPNHSLALGDYDGDGRTDRAIVDRGAGNWHILLSSRMDSSAVGIPWGWHWAGMGLDRLIAMLVGTH